jgi:hypothetical protein
MDATREVAGWLATYRAVRLLQRDDVWPLPELREKLQSSDTFMLSRWAILLDCPGCLSVWVAAGLGLLRLTVPRVHAFLVAVLAGSAVAVVLSEWMERLEADTTGG